ncbi:ferritin-like domain-containing protein [Dethiothermospora halolimnae]|uniref:ferritin-like domain-containing protein n=1 Tax=Dethiothermospora halolimnae TaxID=3114390 RepID=UPI003CCC3930
MANIKAIFKYAMQMELDGHKFFKEKAKEFVNPTSKKMFENLARVEMDHYDFLKEQLDEYTNNNEFKKLDPSIADREKDIFKSREESEYLKETLEQSDIPDMTILRMAYLIERDYAEFYRKAAANVEDIKAKEIFNMLAKWEDGHEELFKKEYDRMMNEYMTLPWGG